MCKFLISDVDHTIYFLDNRSVRNSKAIKEFQNAGNKVIACTGRSLNGIIETEKEIDIKFDYYLLLNGAMVVDEKMNIISHKYIDESCIQGILDITGNANVSVCVNDGFDYHLVKGNHPKLKLKSISELKEIKLSGLSVGYQGDDNQFDDLLNGIANEINRVHGEMVTAYKNTRYIDIVPKGCSKGYAIKKLQQKWKLENKDIFTIGDSENDITMLENKDYVSFTFNDSKEFLKEMVNHVVMEFPECIDILNNQY
ncbi:MAG: HAD-IIB family hydrolase [Sarcina sp.]